MTTKRSIALCIILSIVTCGIYGIYWSSNSGILYLILCLLGLGIIAWALMQSELNKFAEQ